MEMETYMGDVAKSLRRHKMEERRETIAEQITDLVISLEPGQCITVEACDPDSGTLFRVHLPCQEDRA